jgi:hypothetical protein
MARITFSTGEDRDVPDAARPTERGVEWMEGDGESRLQHTVPWSAIAEFIGPRPMRSPIARSGKPR